MDWSLVGAMLLIGAATGFAAGLLGIGGGMLLVPFMTFLFTLRNFPEEHLIHMAIATSLATVMFTSMSSVRAHHQRGAVLWPVVKVLAPGILLGSLIGAQIAGQLPTKVIGFLFAIFVGFSAVQTLRNKKPKPSRELPKPLGMFAVGNGIGLLSALVGAGGAFISVPFMVWSNVPIHSALGTSAALGFPLAVAGTVGYVIAGISAEALPPGTLGFVYIPALLAVSAGSVLTAPLGAKVAHATDTRRLKGIFAMLLFALGGYMLYRALKAA
jgi:uncharacterized membrane protein YfcA